MNSINTLALLILLVFEAQVICASNNQPIRMAYISVQKPATWSDISLGLGIPTICAPNIYQIFSMKQWDPKGPAVTAAAWTMLDRYLPQYFGNNQIEKQRRVKELYREGNIKLLLKVFGYDNTLTLTKDYSASQLAYQVAQFIKTNLFDGADVTCQDDRSFLQGNGEAWFINFTLTLRKYLPNHMMIHTTDPVLMRGELYPNGGYLKINRAVGHLIDFYHLRYYYPQKGYYTTYNEMFINNTGPSVGSSAVGELIMRGIPRSKIIVGKQTNDTSVNNLGSWLVKAYNQLNWSTGVAIDFFQRDQNGTIIQNAARPLMNCLDSGDCQVNDQ